MLPRQSSYKILKSTQLRVSQQAITVMDKAIKERIAELGQKAGALARHAGRKTILEEDVNFFLDRK